MQGDALRIGLGAKHLEGWMLGWLVRLVIIEVNNVGIVLGLLDMLTVFLGDVLIQIDTVGILLLMSLYLYMDQLMTHSWV